MSISFVIPFHNEEENVVAMVEKVLNYAKKQKWDFEIIPVDDRSSDRTPNLLIDLSKKYHLVKPIYRKKDKEEKGDTMGRALIAGTKKSSGRYVIWTMGDLSDREETYKTIVDKLGQDFDLVFASRYMKGGSRGNLDRVKAILSSIGTRLAQLLFGIKVNDITNAFRGFRRDIFAQLTLTSSGFSISPEFALKAHLAGFRLSEVPTVYTNRVKGVSNFKLIRMSKNYLLLYLKMFIEYKLAHQLFKLLV